MYISDTYHLFYLSTTKPSGPDHLLHLVLANLSIIQESFFFFFLEIPASFCRHGSGHERLGLRPHYRDESPARDMTGFQGEMHLCTPVPRHW